MNTKEAIRWLNANKYLTRYKEVIELLQRGEKFEQIVKSIEWRIKASKEVDSEAYGWLKFIEGIIQKYFPEETKK